MNSPVSEARQTLLRALESIERLEEEIGADVRHICVVYSAAKEQDDAIIVSENGWNQSSDPPWLIAAMLRTVADQIEFRDDVAEDDEHE